MLESYLVDVVRRPVSPCPSATVVPCRALQQVNRSTEATALRGASTRGILGPPPHPTRLQAWPPAGTTLPSCLPAAPSPKNPQESGPLAPPCQIPQKPQRGAPPLTTISANTLGHLDRTGHYPEQRNLPRTASDQGGTQDNTRHSQASHAQDNSSSTDRQDSIQDGLPRFMDMRRAARGAAGVPHHGARASWRIQQEVRQEAILSQAQASQASLPQASPLREAQAPPASLPTAPWKQPCLLP